MMVWQNVVSPVKTGVQCFYNFPKILDSGFRRNDDPQAFSTSYDFIVGNCSLLLIAD
jgi:hypothetical protein